MTSLELSRINKKRHYNILRDIREEIINHSLPEDSEIFRISSYLDRGKKPRILYQINETGLKYLLWRYRTKDSSMVYIEIRNILEKYLKEI